LNEVWGRNRRKSTTQKREEERVSTSNPTDPVKAEDVRNWEKGGGTLSEFPLETETSRRREGNMRNGWISISGGGSCVRR